MAVQFNCIDLHFNMRYIFSGNFIHYFIEDNPNIYMIYILCAKSDINISSSYTTLITDLFNKIIL